MYSMGNPMKLRITSVLAASALLAACSATPTKTNADLSATTQAASPAAAVETDQQKSERIVKELGAKSVYFDYDNFTIKPEYQDLLKRDSDLLKSAPALNVTIEGNTDDRGSREYNLALGQKRAEAVKRALKVLGVPDARMEAISYGMERPRATCQEEKCWAENRRADIAQKVGDAK